MGAIAASDIASPARRPSKDNVDDAVMGVATPKKKARLAITDMPAASSGDVQLGTEDTNTVEHVSDDESLRFRSKSAGRSPCPSPMRSDAASSQVSTMRAIEDDKSLRVKPPAHWHRILVPLDVFRGKSFTKQMRFAADCVDRTKRSCIVEAGRLQQVLDKMQVAMALQEAFIDESTTYDGITSLIAACEAKGVPLPAEKQLHVIGLYLVKKLEEMKDMPSKPRAADEFVEALNPFPEFEQCDPENEGDEEVSIVQKPVQAFNYKLPSMQACATVSTFRFAAQT